MPGLASVTVSCNGPGSGGESIRSSRLVHPLTAVSGGKYEALLFNNSNDRQGTDRGPE